MRAVNRACEPAAHKPTSLDASAQLARHVVPEQDRIELALFGVLNIAGAAERGELDYQGQPFAELIFAHLLKQAIAGGFREGAMLACHGKAKACTPVSMRLAADMVRCVGGHDAVLDIIDLHTLNPNEYGALQ